MLTETPVAQKIINKMNGSNSIYQNYTEKIKEKHRILSVCLSKLEAKNKVKEYKKIEGFSSHISNFYIEEYILDEIKN